MTENPIINSGDRLMPAKIVYGLFALGYFIGLTQIAGVIFAYLARGKDAVADSHLTFLIRTFWISLAIAVVGFLTLMIGVGFLVFLGLLVWGLTRIISGFLLLLDKKPISGTKALGLLAY